MHVKTSLTMHNATNSATKHVNMILENLYEEQIQMQNRMKTPSSKWHGNNAMRECVKCLRQGLYL